MQLIKDLPLSKELDSSTMTTIEGGTNEAPTEAISFSFNQIQETPSTGSAADVPGSPDPIRFYFGWR